MEWTEQREPLSRVAGVATIASGAVEFFRSRLGTTTLVRSMFGTRPLEAWFALALVAFGLGLLTLRRTRRSAAVRHVVTIMSAALLSAALASLVVQASPLFVTGASLTANTQTLRVVHPLSSFTLACAAACLLSLTLRRGRVVANVLALVVAGSGLFVLLRFVHDIRFASATDISWTTALTALCAGAGLLAACGPGAWPVRLFLESSVRAQLLRWLVPYVALTVTVTDIAMLSFFSGASTALGSVLNTLVSVAAAAVVSTFLGRAIERKLARQRTALRESEERLRTVFESVPAGLSLTDFHDGRLIDINAEFERLYGWSKAEAQGHTTVELGIWSDSSRRGHLLARVDEVGGAAREEEVMIHRRDGSPRLMRVAVRTLDFQGRKVLVTASVDITSAKEAAEAVRRSEEKFSSIFRESPLSLAVTEYESGRYVDVNDAFLKLTGVPSAEFVLGKTSAELGLLTFEDRDAVVRAALAAGKRYDLMVSGTRLNGETYTGQLSISSYEREGRRYLLGGMIDLSERVRAERERLRAEQRFRELIEGVRDVVFALTPEGIISSLNPAFEQVTGLPMADGVGRPFAQFLHADDVDRAQRALEDTIDGRAADMSPLRIGAHDSYRACEVSWTPHVEEGRVTGVFGISRDISERVGLEEQLRQAQKMEAVGQLAGGIAHDFNNLLNVIILSGDFVLMSLPLDRPERKDVEQALEAAQRAAELTRQLLAFSRRQLLEPRDLDLNGVVAKMHRMLERVLGEHIVLRDVPAPDLAAARVDASQMEQVLLNLAVNARDAMPQGGELTMTTANVVLDETAASKQPGAHAGPYVRLSVLDTGTGMTEQVKARIFEPFFTTKSVGKGTGLGLSTVFGIVRQSGGFIVVESELGRGTCFDVYLPQAERSASVHEENNSTVEPLSGTETILITEDNAVLRALIGKALRGYGYAVIEANSAETALHLAATLPGTIDVLVTDVVLPGMHGRALAEQLALTRPALKVLFASGHSDDTIADQGVLAPGIVVLRKPFSPHELARKVRELLRRQKHAPSVRAAAR